jgi:hypothetical protein
MDDGVLADPSGDTGGPQNPPPKKLLFRGPKLDTALSALEPEVWACPILGPEQSRKQ